MIKKFSYILYLFVKFLDHILKIIFKKSCLIWFKEFLGEIPINPEVGKQGDKGSPIVESMPDHEISKIYLEFAEKIKSTYL